VEAQQKAKQCFRQGEEIVGGGVIPANVVVGMLNGESF